MEPFPPKFSKVLVTPDPQYIPGYAGYCPQLKFTLGETYGKLTARLLSSPEVSRSSQLILYNSNAAPSGQKENGDRELPEQAWDGLPEFRRHPARMLPGYTGFIPKSQNYFFRTYTETCREALSEFHKDLQKRKRLTASAELPRINNKPTLGYYSTPLTPIAIEPAPYNSPDPWKPQGSPYSMDRGDPNKYFISGFTGYIPKSRFLFGSGFPAISNKALIQFDREQRDKDGALRPAVEELPPVTTIYPPQSGLVPCYTGHVPGYRFGFGQTYGQLTHNAMGSSGALKGR